MYCLLYLLKERMLYALFQHELQPKLKGGFTMTKTYVIKAGEKPTEEQLREVGKAKKQPIVFDEDCRELSPAMVKAFKCAVVNRNRRKN